MSIKIYNAWRTTKELRSILPALKRLRAAEEAMFTAQVKAMLSCREDVLSIDPLDAAVSKVDTAFFTARSILTGEHAFNPVCEAVVYPHPGSGSVVQLFGTTREGSDYLRRTLNAKDYHYQDQCERDESISEEEWAERKRAWERMLLKGSGIPSDHGFSYELITKRRGLEMLFTQLRISIPPDPAYLERLASENRMHEWRPEDYGMFIAQDVEWAWKGGKAPFAKVKQQLIEGWLKPFTLADQSLNSSML